MGLINMLPTHKVLEVNFSTALRAGDLISQIPYYAGVGETYVDNGRFFCLSTNGTLVKPGDNTALLDQYFIHYTEELLTLGFVQGLKFYTTEMDRTDDTGAHCYPRCLNLYTNDTFTTDNFAGTLSTAKFATINDDGVLQLLTRWPIDAFEGPLFAVKASTLPDGTAAAEVTVISAYRKETADPRYDVDFSTDGGSVVTSIEGVVAGDKIVAPSPVPTKTGYSFGGWYKEVGLTNAWIFASDTVTEDITLYAKWNALLYTVSYESNGGSEVEEEEVNFGGLVTEPTEPTKSEATFDGWYSNAELTTAWTFATDTVAGDMTLYAKWV